MKEYLFVVKPELLLEWDYDKNIGIDPKTITKCSHKKYWWRCNKGCGNHSWKSSPASRFRGSGCVICCNPPRQICSCGCNSLLKLYPDIAKEWDYDKNVDDNENKVTPADVMPGSGYLADWICQAGCGNHRYSQYVYQRTGKQKTGCPICSIPSKAVCPCGCNSLAQMFPEIAKMWDYDKNKETYGEDVTPYTVTPGSSYNIWWKCDKKCGNHSWQSLISNITKQDRVNECPICADICVCPCGCNSLATKYPAIMSQWDHDKNRDDDGRIIIPSTLLPGSHYMAWWKCDKKCGNHSWKAQVKSRVFGGHTCPICTQKEACPCGCNSLETLYPEIAKEWHPDNTLLPSQVLPFSNYKIKWRCLNSICGKHIWETTPGNRVMGTGCPYCSNPIKKVCPCGCNSLEKTHPEIANLWDYDNNTKILSNINPSNISYGCKIQVYWKNKECKHIWIRTIPGMIKSSECPICCTKKQYSKIAIQWLKYISIGNSSVQHAETLGGEYKIPNSRYKADGYCPITNTIYEFHGDLWHGNPNKFKSNDINPLTKTTYGELYNKTIQKKQFIIEKGYKYIAIWEDDWKRFTRAIIILQRKWLNKN